MVAGTGAIQSPAEGEEDDSSSDDEEEALLGQSANLSTSTRRRSIPFTPSAESGRRLASGRRKSRGQTERLSLGGQSPSASPGRRRQLSISHGASETPIRRGSGLNSPAPRRRKYHAMSGAKKPNPREQALESKIDQVSVSVEIYSPPVSLRHPAIVPRSGSGRGPLDYKPCRTGHSAADTWQGV